MTLTISRPATSSPLPMIEAPDAPNTQQAKRSPIPKLPAPAGANSPAPNDHPTPTQSAAREPKQADGRGGRDAQKQAAVGSNVPDPAARPMPSPIQSSLLDPALSLAADVLDDIERVRIANQNRLRQLTRTGEDVDGEERGFGLDPTHPDVLRLAVMVETLEKVEHEATLNLQRKMRKHSLGAWMKAQRGIGEKQGARLLAAIGDPYVNSAKGTPRTVSALWAYCGLHVLPGGQGPLDNRNTNATEDQPSDTDQNGADTQSVSVGVAAKRRKGQRANWSTNAKMRAYLIAESCMKQLSPQCRDGHVSDDAHMLSAVPACACSPYRVTYDGRRAHTAVTHADWSDGHSHNDALRVAAKAILRDLWRAARDYHLSEVSA